VGTLRLGPDGTRFVIARGVDFYGLWDWEHPESPVARFNLNREGMDQALDLWRDQAVLPLLDLMGLEGDSAAGTADSLGVPVIVRFTLQRRVFVILCLDVPRTYVVADPSVPEPEGVDRTRDEPDYMRLETLSDALRLAEARVNRGEKIRWRSIPTGCATLRQAYDWIRAHQT
jgi:hypothetical protein